MANMIANQYYLVYFLLLFLSTLLFNFIFNKLLKLKTRSSQTPSNPTSLTSYWSSLPPMAITSQILAKHIHPIWSKNFQSTWSKFQSWLFTTSIRSIISHPHSFSSSLKSPVKIPNIYYGAELLIRQIRRVWG